MSLRNLLTVQTNKLVLSTQFTGSKPWSLTLKQTLSLTLKQTLSLTLNAGQSFFSHYLSNIKRWFHQLDLDLHFLLVSVFSINIWQQTFASLLFSSSSRDSGCQLCIFCECVQRWHWNSQYCWNSSSSNGSACSMAYSTSNFLCWASFAPESGDKARQQLLWNWNPKRWSKKIWEKLEEKSAYPEADQSIVWCFFGFILAFWVLYIQTNNITKTTSFRENL